MSKNISLISVCLIFLITCGANAGEQTNCQLRVPKVSNTNLAAIITESIHNIQMARKKIDNFLKTHDERKPYHGWWSVTEIIRGATNGYIQVIFDKKDGPPKIATERFFGDSKYTNSTGGFELYFHTNGTVKSFETFGTNRRILQFEDSGAIKDFIAPGVTGTIAVLRCGKDGSIEYEKMSKDKEGEGVSPTNKNKER